VLFENLLSFEMFISDEDKDFGELISLTGD
jgi:hypothetical protein